MMTAGAVRRPAVAGYYYPADPAALAASIDALAPAALERQPALGAIVPHGSVAAAGRVLAATLGRIALPARCVIIGASHTDTWKPWSLMREGAYLTPLGEVPVDADAARELQAACPFLETDPEAQRGEHAIEVVLPVLQRLGPPELAIVPIITGGDDADEFLALGVALAACLRRWEPTLLIASTDCSGFEPEAAAREQDEALLSRLAALDAEGLIRRVRDHGVLMCGYGAAAAVVHAARRLGARRAILAGYATSAEAGGDPHAVTGHAGLIVPAEARA